MFRKKKTVKRDGGAPSSERCSQFICRPGDGQPWGIVAVAHIDPSHAHEKHPTKFGAESGHPVVTVYPPLAQFAPHRYTGLRRLVQWRRVAPVEVCNH